MSLQPKTMGLSVLLLGVSDHDVAKLPMIAVSALKDAVNYSSNYFYTVWEFTLCYTENIQQ